MKKPFSPNLYTFFIGVILLGGPLLSTAEENPSRTKKNSISGTNNIHYGEYIALSYYSFVVLVRFQKNLESATLSFLQKNSTCNFWKN
jgi:hypothetical protein